MQPQCNDFIHEVTMRPSADGFFQIRPLLYCGHVRMTVDSHCFSEEEDGTPQAPSPHVDQSRPNRSDVYQSSTQNADTTTLRAYKVNDIVLSILIIATPGDLGLSRL
jgi:hypothetical protein